MSFLIGKKVLLRPVRKKDLCESYAEWINNQDGDVYTEHALFPHTVEDLERYYEEKNGSRCVWLAVIEKTTGRHVGNIELSGIDQVHRKGTFSILIGDAQARNKGYGYEASVLLLEHAFRKLNLNRIELGVHEDNKPAIALYRRLGFVEEGRQRKAFLRNGVYRNTVIMGLLAEDFEKAGPRKQSKPRRSKR